MDQKKNEMEYRFLGPTGLKVSCLGYGNWISASDPKEEQVFNDVIKTCFDNGINFFDTAEGYGTPYGTAEIQMGNALKKLNTARENLVVTTKIWRGGFGPNSIGGSRKHVIEGANNSLKRMQLDFVDVIYAHRHDDDTLIEETVRAFNWLIENGKAFYWGTSEWDAKDIMEAYAVCDRLNLIKPVVEQPQYNMLVRDRFEVEYGTLFDRYGMGSTIWSPLAGGLLTGKYNNGDLSSGGRGQMDGIPSQAMRNFFDPANKEKTVKTLTTLADIAKELGCSQAQLSLAWALKNKNVSTCIFGATKVSQVEDNIKACAFINKITPEIEARIEKALDNRPKTGMNWKKWVPKEPRR